MDAYPQAVHVANGQGHKPIDFLKRLPYRDVEEITKYLESKMVDTVIESLQAINT